MPEPKRVCGMHINSAIDERGKAVVENIRVNPGRAAFPCAGQRGHCTYTAKYEVSDA